MGAAAVVASPARVTPLWFDLTRLSLRTWILVGLADAALAATCVMWVARPVARLMHEGVADNPLWPILTHTPGLLTLFAFTLLLLLPWMAWPGRLQRLRRTGQLHGIKLASASFLFSFVMKSVLKWTCGRPWPETWTHNNPSFMRDGVYGFFPFHGGGQWAAFPSGHMTATMSVVVIGWQLWPSLAPFWIFAALGAAGGLIGMNFHFVGDVVAGAFVGTASAATVLWASRQLDARREARV